MTKQESEFMMLLLLLVHLLRCLWKSLFFGMYQDPRLLITVNTFRQHHVEYRTVEYSVRKTKRACPTYFTISIDCVYGMK